LVDDLDPIPHHSGQTQPGQHLFIDDDDYQAKLKCGLFSKRKNANKKILRARNPKLLVQKRRMLTFRDKKSLFQKKIRKNGLKQLHWSLWKFQWSPDQLQWSM